MTAVSVATRRAAAVPPDLTDPAAVRAYLERSVLRFEIRDLAVPIVASAWSLAILFWAWGVAKSWASIGDYFLVPCLISAAGLGVAQAALGAWFFNRHRWKGRAVVGEEDAVVARAEVFSAQVARRGAPVPGGPPAVVRVGARFADGRVLAWNVQALPWRGGVGAGQADRTIATLGAVAHGRWLLAVDRDGEVLWPTEPAAVLEPRGA
ncbi:MAG: hypothetical protein ACRD0L_09310 [Acidimicrobiales bacterium]